jgi:subtilisin family serine protease
MFQQLKGFAKLGFVVFVAVALVSGLSWAQEANPARRIVVFRGQFVNEQAQQALVEQSGGAVVKSLPLINGMAVVLPEPAQRALRLAREVLRVDDDAEVHALPKPPSPPGQDKKPPDGDEEPPPEELPWGVDRIDAEYAWLEGLTGAGIEVAVVDTGIDYNHPDLANNCKGGVNVINVRKGYKDDNGHGTHVAGIIAAEDNDIGVIGVAPEAWLYGVKVLDRRGSGFVSDVIDGITWCIENGMNIANMSLGTNADIQSLQDACDAAYDAGVLLVAAAGNDGGAVDFPAAYDSVIAVAATDVSDVRPNWSSHGPQVLLAAPGVEILSTWKGGDYRTGSGTSMASPHVAGTAALNLAGDIYGSADDLTPAGRDEYTGFGLVDAGEAATGIHDYGDDLP